jgi:cytochrome P450
MVSSPDGVRDLLETLEDRFEKGRGERRFTRRLLGRGLLGSEGRFHRRQHALVYPSLHREALAQTADEIVAGAVRMEQGWRPGEVMDAFDLLSRVTTDVMIEALFGVEVTGPDGAELALALDRAVGALEHLPLPFLAVSKRLPFPANRRFDLAKRRLDSLLAGRIALARASDDEGDGSILTRLVRARRTDGTAMDDRLVRDEALTIFRGHKTAGTALCWAWYLVSRHPDVESSVLEEIDAVLGGREPTAASYEDLVVCRRVVHEAMRLFPPAWLISRRAAEDVELGGFRVPSGSTVVASPYVVHRDPRWHPEPRRFDPDRFLPERRAGWHRFAYFPFGGGTKKCLGDAFAPFEAVLLMAAIGRRWRLRPAPGHRVRPDPKATLKPRGGMPFVLQAR